MTDTIAREDKINDARIFAENIIDTIRESLLVLDADVCVVSANAAFYRTFMVSEEGTVGRKIYELGNGQWDIPRLRELLEKIIPESCQFNDFEIEHDFPLIGRKAMILNARKIKQEDEQKELILLAIEDVTEREAQKKLLVQAHTIINVSPDIILRFGCNGRLLFANRAAETLFGRPRNEIVGRTLEELFVSPEVRAAIRDAFRRVNETKKAAIVEMRLRDTTFQMLLAPEHGEQGNIFSFITSSRDIGQLKQIESSLIEAAETARRGAQDAEEGKRILTAIAEDADGKKRILMTIMDNLLEGLIVVDGEGNVQMISTSMSLMTGLEQKDILGKPVAIVEDLLAQEPATPSAPGEFPVHRALHRGEKTQGEGRTIQLPNGEKKDISINAAPIMNTSGRVVGALAAWRDISKRKKAEDILRQNKFELRTLMESSPDIIVRLDRNRKYVFANATFERIAGMSREQLAGKTNKELGMPQDMEAQWEKHARNSVESGREESMEFEISGIFGIRTFWGKIVPEFAKSGLVESMMIIARDITDRKKAEEQIRYISFHDKVTGLFNRAYFEEELNRLDTDRMLPLGIIMSDVNHLKLANDVLGHREGDSLLLKIAELLRKSCRDEDIIARWGGDEFAVILPKTDEATAHAIMERIKQACRQSAGAAIQPSLASGVAIKTERGQNIYLIVRQAEEQMYANKLAERRQNEELVLSSLLRRVRENSYDKGQHEQRLEKLADDFRRVMGMSDRQYDNLKLLVRFHDIGMGTIPSEILNKPGHLSPEEWDVVRKYPESSYRVANTFSDTTHIADDVYSIGEHWDGGGYPRGISAAEIPYLSRLLAIIDAYDIMTHPRPYARTFTQEEAIEELRRQAGKKFDPELADKFIEKLTGAAPKQPQGPL